MKKTLTYLVVFLTMFVSATSHSAFNFNTSGAFTTNSNATNPSICYPVEEVCSSNGFTDSGIAGRCIKSDGGVALATSCTLSTPSNSTCSGSGSTRTCSCNSGYSEYTNNGKTTCQSNCLPGFKEEIGGTSTCVSACLTGKIPFATESGPVCTDQSTVENSCGEGQYLNRYANGVYNCGETDLNLGATLAAVLGIIAAGAAAAFTCSAAIVNACVGSLAAVAAAAGILISGTWPNAPNIDAPNNKPLYVNLSGTPDESKTGISRDSHGNLTPVGPNWTKNGNTYTTTNTDGVKTATTVLNTATDKATHTTTNTQTGKTTTTVISGTSKGGGGSIASSVTDGFNVSGGGVDFMNAETPSDISFVTCQNGGDSCLNPNATDGSGGSSGGGGNTGGGGSTGGGGGTGGSSGNGDDDCPECEILTNILNTLRGEGTDGEATLQGMADGIGADLEDAAAEAEDMFNDFMDGLPIKEALDSLGLNPTSYLPISSQCEMDINVLEYHSTFSYCAYQSQIQSATAFFLFLFLLTGLRDLLFERPE